MARPISLFAPTLILLVLLGASCAHARVDQRTGLIRVLFMGDSEMQSGKVAPIMVLDPMLHIDRVPVEGLTAAFPSIDAAARALRTYFPRVERQVHEDYDVLIIADAKEPFFPPDMQNWFKGAVIEHGLGFLMAGGPQSFGGYEPWGHPSWDGSPVSDILPVNLLEDWQWSGRDFQLVPAPGMDDHPLMRNIPWKQVTLQDYNRVLAKEGSVVVGVSHNYPPNSPILTYMEVGEGLSEAFVFDWGGGSVRDFHRWAYGPIALSNIIYWTARVQIPEDMALYLQLRNRITKYLSLRSYAVSVIEFAEKFDANMNSAAAALTEADAERTAVFSSYVEGDYQDSLDMLESALGNLERVSELALKAKNEALFWVYVIEWFTVSGTGMVCGVVLWTLMVRRAAYKEVGTTRLRERE